MICLNDCTIRAIRTALQASLDFSASLPYLAATRDIDELRQLLEHHLLLTISVLEEEIGGTADAAQHGLQ